MTSFNELPPEMKSHILELTGNPIKAATVSKEFEELVNVEAQLCFDTLASSQDDVPALKSAIAQIPKDSSISSLDRIKKLYQVIKNAGYNDSSAFASLQPEQIKNAYAELQEKQDEALLSILPKIATAASLNDPGSISAEDARNWLEDNSSYISSIQDLNLEKCELQVLPPEIEQLKKLEKLNISGNRLTALPPQIGQLTELKQLYAIGNKLTIIPPEIGLLAKLEKLSFVHNELSALPQELWQLKITFLSLSHNQFTAIPPEVGNCMSLKTLNVSYNPLKTLPKEINNCLTLKIIDVSHIKELTLPSLREDIYVLSSDQDD